MEYNIQGLLDKIYEDGVTKAEKEASGIIQKAEEEAARILADAERTAAQVREKARSEVKILRESTEADLKTAADQTIASVKSRIQDNMLIDLPARAIHEAGIDPVFMKEMILLITKSWIEDGVSPDQIEVILPAGMKDKFRTQFLESAGARLDGLEFTDGDLKGGFKISRSDKGYRMDFSEKALEEFFRTWLRKKSAEWLFAG